MSKALQYSSVFLLLGALCACQPKAETPATPKKESAAKTTTSGQSEITSTQEKPSCTQLSQTMTDIDAKSTVEALDTVNAQLKQCLPHAEHAQRMAWMDASSAMYQRFLTGDPIQLQKYEAFEQYGLSLLEANQDNAHDPNKPFPNKGDEQLFKKLATRDQYLFTHQGQSYIELHYQGEGMFTFRRNPAYLKDIFADALPEDQRVFITRMAEDNATLLYNDAAISVSWAELVERALFWESYLKKYPKSPYKTDANRLFKEYQFLIFVGTDNSPVSDEFSTDAWIDEDALKQIKALAKRPNTALAKQAQTFLKFIETTPTARRAQYPVTDVDQEGYEKSSSSIAREQLRKALNLRSPWNDEHGYRECHEDALCYDVRY